MVWLIFVHSHRFWWFCFPRTLPRRTADVQEPGCMGGRQRLDCTQPSRGRAGEPRGLWPRTFSTVNCLVVLLGWGAGNGLIWALLEVFQVCGPFLVCVGLALVQFQRWLNLQRQMWRRELGWKCTGERSPEEKWAFLSQARAAGERDSLTGLPPAPGREQGVFGQSVGAGTGHTGGGWREGQGSFRTSVA